MLSLTFAAASHEALSTAGEKPNQQQEKQLDNFSHRRLYFKFDNLKLSSQLFHRDVSSIYRSCEYKLLLTELTLHWSDHNWLEPVQPVLCFMLELEIQLSHNSEPPQYIPALRQAGSTSQWDHWKTKLVCSSLSLTSRITRRFATLIKKITLTSLCNT